ncbi:oligosaccharide repeat unit polymerase, partial [Staphylococcus borealis]
MIIFLFTLIALLYGLFLFRSNFKFISLFFVATFSVSFLLPVIVDKPFNFNIFVDRDSFSYVNKLYFLALMIFVIANFITQNIKFNFRPQNFTLLKNYNIKKIYPVYIVATILVILLTGLNIISSGSTSTLESNSIVKMLQGSVLMGYLYLSYLYFYNTQNKKDMYKGIIFVLISLILVAIFIFGRRILLYPTIAIIVLY